MRHCLGGCSRKPRAPGRCPHSISSPAKWLVRVTSCSFETPRALCGNPEVAGGDYLKEDSCEGFRRDLPHLLLYCLSVLHDKPGRPLSQYGKCIQLYGVLGASQSSGKPLRLTRDTSRPEIATRSSSAAGSGVWRPFVVGGSEGGRGNIVSLEGAPPGITDITDTRTRCGPILGPAHSRAGTWPPLAPYGAGLLRKSGPTAGSRPPVQNAN